MKLSISNIGWTSNYDTTVYELMKKNGFSGLEIAPTRIFPKSPYDNLDDAREWSNHIMQNFGFSIPSMQSIWFGRQEKLFGTQEERNILLDYTKKAINFANAIGCKNLVFGCPKNRYLPDGLTDSIAVDFFGELGDYAFSHNTAIGMEANPPIYNTNYINNTYDALSLIKKVNSKGFLLNLDVGTMIYNNESVNILASNVKYINHIHISEPGLAVIQERSLHNNLNQILREEGYQGFVSIEMGKQENLNILEKALMYVRRIFDDI